MINDIVLRSLFRLCYNYSSCGIADLFNIGVFRQAIHGTCMEQVTRANNIILDDVCAIMIFSQLSAIFNIDTPCHLWILNALTSAIRCSKGPPCGYYR